MAVIATLVAMTAATPAGAQRFEPGSIDDDPGVAEAPMGPREETPTPWVAEPDPPAAPKAVFEDDDGHGRDRAIAAATVERDQPRGTIGIAVTVLDGEPSHAATIAAGQMRALCGARFQDQASRCHAAKRPPDPVELHVRSSDPVLVVVAYYDEKAVAQATGVEPERAPREPAYAMTACAGSLGVEDGQITSSTRIDVRDAPGCTRVDPPRKSIATTKASVDLIRAIVKAEGQSDVPRERPRIRTEGAAESSKAPEASQSRFVPRSLDEDD